MSETVTIKSCASQQEAEVLKTLLEENGIHSHIMADDYIGLPLNVSGGVQLQVLEEHAAAAIEVLREAATEEDFAEEGLTEEESSEEDAE